MSRQRLGVGERFRCDAFNQLLPNQHGDGVWSLSHGWESGYRGWGDQTSEGPPVSMSSRVGPDKRRTVFVVNETSMSGGGYGHGDHDSFPDGWGVLAHDEADPSFVVFFRQSGCFCNCLDASRIHEVHGSTEVDG